jgi:hypothetical protein
MIHPHTEVRFVDAEVGYGVFATNNIPRGTLVWVLCWLDRILTGEEMANLPADYRALIDRFTYVAPDGQHVLCWDAGRQINHSCSPSMRSLGQGYEIAVRDVATGEQLTCEYGVLNLHEPMACRCGAPGCRGVICGDDALRLWPAWDRQVMEALDDARRVSQPLLRFARDSAAFEDFTVGRVRPPSHHDFHYPGLSAAAVPPKKGRS